MPKITNNRLSFVIFVFGSTAMAYRFVYGLRTYSGNMKRVFMSKPRENLFHRSSPFKAARGVLYNGKVEDMFVEKLRQSLCCNILSEFLDSEKELMNPLIIMLNVSGGSDSVAMFHGIMFLIKDCLDSLNQYYELPCEILSPEKGKMCLTIRFQIHVVHFDHCQRGAESTADRVFVKKLCDNANIPYHSLIWGEDDCDNKMNIRFSQETARNWRKRNVQTILEKLISDRTSFHDDLHRGLIFTAHHADDSDETMMLKILRGAHVSNLSGISSLSYCTKDKTYAFARPLLNIRKDEIISFLKRHNLSWREDESNLSSKYLRNRVRNELLPLIHDMVGGKEIFQKRLKNLKEQSLMFKQDLDIRTEKYFEDYNFNSNDMGFIPFILPPSFSHLDIVQLNALHQWACRCMAVMEENKHILDYSQLQRIHLQLINYPNNKKWTLNIGKGWNLKRDRQILEIYFSKSSRK